MKIKLNGHNLLQKKPDTAKSNKKNLSRQTKSNKTQT